MSKLKVLGYVQIVGATIIPKEPSDPVVEFTVRIPKTAGLWRKTRLAALVPIRAKCPPCSIGAYLAAVDFMHLSAEQGKAIEQAVKGKDGKLQPNPSARYVRGLTKGELTEMIGLDTSKRDNPRRAIAAFERLAADEVINLDRDGSLFRIFGPPKSFSHRTS